MWNLLEKPAFDASFIHERRISTVQSSDRQCPSTSEGHTRQLMFAPFPSQPGLKHLIEAMTPAWHDAGPHFLLPLPGVYLLPPEPLL